MRLFVTSYQKAGTHQIVPALQIARDVVDRSYVDFSDLEDWIPYTTDEFTVEDAVQDLKKFTNDAFGHLPYLPEYAQVFREYPTRVLFNVRDPRDVIVSNYYNIQKVYARGTVAKGHLNMVNVHTGKLLIESDDPITELIKIAAKRWKYWLGWMDEDFTLVVKYEDLRTDPRTTLNKIKNFISPHFIDVENCLKEMIPKRENPTFRAGRIGDWKREFTSTQKQLANDLLGYAIQRLGYEL